MIHLVPPFVAYSTTKLKNPAQLTLCFQDALLFMSTVQLFILETLLEVLLLNEIEGNFVLFFKFFTTRFLLD